MEWGSGHFFFICHRNGNRQTRRVFSVFLQYVIMDLLLFGLTTTKWLMTYVREKFFFSMHINCLQQNTRFYSFKNSSVVNKVKTQSGVFWALPSFSETRRFDPENEMSTPPVKALSLSLGDITVSNRGVKSCALEVQQCSGSILTTRGCIHKALQVIYYLCHGEILKDHINISPDKS